MRPGSSGAVAAAVVRRDRSAVVLLLLVDKAQLFPDGSLVRGILGFVGGIIPLRERSGVFG